MQHEITEKIPLLNREGNLTQAGYAKRLLPVYCRSAVKGGATRLKEWDRYMVMGEGFALTLTIADHTYMGLDSISLIDLNEGWQRTKHFVRVFPIGNTGLPISSEQGDVAVAGRGYGLFFGNDGKTRVLSAHMNKFKDGADLDVQITLSDPPEESMVLCTPFSKPGHFYFNQKINCMRASGTVNLGHKEYPLSPKTCFGTLDWGRGVWTYQNTCYWSSASGLVEGVPFGFNVGYGFGDTSAATENMIFYEGKAHKLSRVMLQIPRKGGRKRFMEPWNCTSEDGRFEMTFTPVQETITCTNLGLLKSNQHQVFGRFTGCAVLEDGVVVKVRDLIGFAERVEHKW